MKYIRRTAWILQTMAQDVRRYFADDWAEWQAMHTPAPPPTVETDPYRWN